MREILELERRGWEALSSEAGAAKDFYASVLHEDAVMLFPGGVRLVGKEAVLNSLDSQPWASFEIQQPELIEITDRVKTLAYNVSARREGSALYEALISSTYVRKDGSLKLILHHQTQA